MQWDHLCRVVWLLSEQKLGVTYHKQIRFLLGFWLSNWHTYRNKIFLDLHFSNCMILFWWNFLFCEIIAWRRIWQIKCNSILPKYVFKYGVFNTLHNNLFTFENNKNYFHILSKSHSIQNSIRLYSKQHIWNWIVP